MLMSYGVMTVDSQEAFALAYKVQADSHRFADENVAKAEDEVALAAAELFRLRCSRPLPPPGLIQVYEESLDRKEDYLCIFLLLRAKTILIARRFNRDSPNQLRLRL
jgi:hypothetical protein